MHNLLFTTILFIFSSFSPPPFLCHFFLLHLFSLPSLPFLSFFSLFLHFFVISYLFPFYFFFISSFPSFLFSSCFSYVFVSTIHYPLFHMSFLSFFISFFVFFLLLSPTFPSFLLFTTIDFSFPVSLFLFSFPTSIFFSSTHYHHLFLSFLCSFLKFVSPLNISLLEFSLPVFFLPSFLPYFLPFFLSFIQYRHLFPTLEPDATGSHLHRPST